ncbi:MAG: hypothetical protein EXR62_13815 [Chloroflexi bacterium]|nr:hypothetical protein [Chloroflexota bacterium]
MANTTHPDMIEATCADGHISYYNKHDVCGPHGIVWRKAQAEASGANDTLLLPCEHPGCQHKTSIIVDCRGYR